jgi:hypothetical protein
MDVAGAVAEAAKGVAASESEALNAMVRRLGMLTLSHRNLADEPAGL